MRKYLPLLLCLMLVCIPLASCGNGKTDTEPEEEYEEALREAENIAEVDEETLEEAGDTLESRLSLLKKDGWKERDGAYVYTSDDEGCKGEFIITANGNDADITVKFDYYDNNKEMVEFYKDDQEAGKAICAYWYLRAAAVLDSTDSSEKYKLIIGDTEVLNGSMTYAEAEKTYDDYFEE